MQFHECAQRFPNFVISFERKKNYKINQKRGSNALMKDLLFFISSKVFLNLSKLNKTFKEIVRDSSVFWIHNCIFHVEFFFPNSKETTFSIKISEVSKIKIKSGITLNALRLQNLSFSEEKNWMLINDKCKCKNSLFSCIWRMVLKKSK